jgi:hypothetical protein
VKKLLIILVVLLAAIQVIPVNRSNPPVTRDVEADAQMKALLRRACYDCHSNETVWPFYSYIAPVSWLVAHHVNEGREEMNFSEWDKLDREKALKLITESAEEVQEGEMPLKIYIPFHPGAALNESEKKLFKQWAESLVKADVENAGSKEDKDEDEEDDE